MKELSGNIGSDSQFEAVNSNQIEFSGLQGTSSESNSEISVCIPEEAFNPEQSLGDAIKNAYLANGGPHEVPTAREIHALVAEVVFVIYHAVTSPKDNRKIAV